MKTRKAGLALALALALLLTLTACGTQGMPTPDPVPANTYSAEDFVVAGGFLTYDGDGPSYVGVDVSAHQGEIDWERVADAGIDFAMIRAGYRGYTEGGIFQDEYFVQNMEGAIAAGLEVGVYFFSQAVDEEEAVEEARQVLEWITPYDVAWQVVFDWERVSQENSHTLDTSGDASPSAGRWKRRATCPWCTSAPPRGIPSWSWSGCWTGPSGWPIILRTGRPPASATTSPCGNTPAPALWTAFPPMWI